MSGQLELWDGGGVAPAGPGSVAFEIRESAKARRLILQVVPPRMVEVVVPRGVRPREVESFIREHDEWISRAKQELLRAFPIVDLQPSAVELAAIGKRIVVRYDRSQSGQARYRCGEGELRLCCAQREFEDAPDLLRRWLLREARAHLKPWLMRQAEITGLVPQGVQVRLQRTRWGSCSSGGNISLNAALLLVAPELVRYLFVHELAHLKHLSHSRRFWRTVARHEPDFRQLDGRLAACWQQMPAWLTPSGRARG